MVQEKIYTNCQVITRDRMFHGSVVVCDGRIRSVDGGNYHGPGAIDLEGDLLLPGLVEMHTDNLEKNIQPRPGVIWPSTLSAVLAHDAQLVGAGITTVCDAIAVGGLRESSLRERIFAKSIEAICSGSRQGMFKADHYLHLRCEISHERMMELLEQHGDRPELRLLSVMDHTPGQRQWRDLDKWRQYHRDKRWTDAEAAVILGNLLEKQRRFGDKHRKLAVAFAHDRKIPLASHDDTTPEDVLDAAGEGIGIAEFPTTLEAARQAREQGIDIIMGAPNAIRGISHSGNISARLLAEERLLDGLSSDYVPSSLLHSAFHLAEKQKLPLPDTVAMVSGKIAGMLGFTDRGELAPDKRADMLQVSIIEGLPVLRRVWVAGRQGRYVVGGRSVWGNVFLS